MKYMNAQEIIESLMSIEDFSIDSFIIDFDDHEDPDAMNSAVSNLVGNYHSFYVRDNDEVQKLWYFKDHDVLLAIDGYHNSWTDDDFSEAEFYEAFPEVEMVVKYVGHTPKEFDMDILLETMYQLENQHKKEK